MSIKKEDIPNELHTLIDIVGIDNFAKLAKYYGGTSIYIPVYRKIIIGNRNREIVSAYNGKNINDLGRKYGLTIKQIRKIIENG